MRIYENDSFKNRGCTWQPPMDCFNFPQNELPFADCYSRPYPPCLQCPCCPNPFPPCPSPCCKPFCCLFPYPVVCCPQMTSNCPNPCPNPKPPCPKKAESVGYFSSITTGGAFAGGIIPLTFADPLNRNVVLNAPGNTQVVPQFSGMYRIVYSVTTTAASTGAFLQLLRNGQTVSTSPIPIQEGVNGNEILLNLSRNDTLSLNLTAPVTLANGKNASIFIQLISHA